MRNVVVSFMVLVSELFDFVFFFFLKNLEAEKQVKFFQGCVAAAFAERDNSIMEVVIAIKSELDILLHLEFSCCIFFFWLKIYNFVKMLHGL